MIHALNWLPSTLTIRRGEPHTSKHTQRNMTSAAEALKEKGNVAFRSGDYLQAEDLYTQALQKNPHNPLLFTNRANARLRLHRWDDAVNDCLKSIEIMGPTRPNTKAFYFLGQIALWQSSTMPLRPLLTVRTAQAQLALHHPHEALSSALTAYEQAKFPPPSARTLPRDLETFSAFVLKCKKAKFATRDRDRLRRQGDLRAELEEASERKKQADLDDITQRLHSTRIGPVEAAERKQEILSDFDAKINALRNLFAAADPATHKPREIPDHLVDMITFEPMHDPVITKNGHSYERATIYEHLKRSPTDPLTREPLSVGDLRNNFGLKAACDEFWEGGASDWILDW